MQVTSWTDLLREFDNALAVVRGLGLGDRLDSSRLAAYRERIAHLASVLQREGDEATMKAFDADDLNSIALAEAHEFVVAAPYIYSLDPKAVSVNK